jgi:hypothetical protein
MPDLVASIAAHPRRRDRTVIGVRPQVVLARSNAFPAVAHNNAARPLARSNAVPLARSDALAGGNIAARVLLAVRNAPHCKTSLVRSRLRLQQPLKFRRFKSYPRYHRWRSFLLREKFENRARLEVKAFVVVDGKDLNSRIGLYAQRRLDLMRRPLGRPSAPP